MPRFKPPDKTQIDKMKELYKRHTAHDKGNIDPQIEKLMVDLVGAIADKWTMLVLELLVEHGVLRFTELGKLVGGISQKMLTQTVRRMERDGLLTRKIYPVVPPRVEYKATDLGITLSVAFCSMWVWALANLDTVEDARRRFDKKQK